ncbi:hypothetical protein ACQ4PT_024726 [Festuca glaucescens]
MSMYADDVVTFIRPTEVDLRTCTQIVEDFGVASGLRTNLAKCSLHPIRCSQEQVDLASSILGCEVASFPFKYLGLPLGLRKVTAAQLQPIMDSAASSLPPWCAKLLNRGGRTILVQSTLSAIPVHTMMSLDIPPKVVEALRKICRAFLWKGRQEVKGGHCLVAWDKVTSPKDLGGLGIPNLRLLNLSLRCRWAWLQKVDPSKAWAEFNIQLLIRGGPIFSYTLEHELPLTRPLLLPSGDAMASGHIAHCLGGILARRASAAVAVSGGLRLTGAELVDDVRGLAAGLWESGLRPGDVVAVVGFNSIDYMELLLAIPYIGAIIAPLNYRWSFEETTQALELVRPSAFIFDGSYSSWALLLMESKRFSTIGLYLTMGDPVSTSEPANFVSLNHIKSTFRGNTVMEPVSAPRDVALICFTSGKRYGLEPLDSQRV